MAFEEFTKIKGKFTPKLTINARGGFGLSSGMHHRYAIDRYNGVKLYFDKEELKIGIKLMEELGEGVLKLKKRPDEKGAYFSARSFIEAYNIMNYVGGYIPKQIEDPQFGTLFVIDLKAREVV